MIRVFFNIEQIVVEKLKLKVGAHGNADFFTQKKKKKRDKIKKLLTTLYSSALKEWSLGTFAEAIQSIGSRYLLSIRNLIG